MQAQQELTGLDEDLRLACHSILSLEREKEGLIHRVTTVEEQLQSQAQQLSHQKLELDKERARSAELLEMFDAAVEAKKDAARCVEGCEGAVQLLQQERDHQREDLLHAEGEQQRLSDELHEAREQSRSLETQLKHSKANEASTKARLTKQLIAAVEALRETERNAAEVLLPEAPASALSSERCWILGRCCATREWAYRAGVNRSLQD